MEIEGSKSEDTVSEEDSKPAKSKPEGLKNRSDLLAHVFWKDGTICVFDAKITYADTLSNRDSDPEKLLERKEKAKKTKHINTCHERQCNFTPLCFTANGMAADEATATMKRLGTLLAQKWQRPRSEMIGFVCFRMQLSIVRVNTMLLRGSRVEHI